MAMGECTFIFKPQFPKVLLQRFDKFQGRVLFGFRLILHTTVYLNSCFTLIGSMNIAINIITKHTII